MFSALKRFCFAVLSIPKGLFVYLKSKKLDFSTMRLFIRHPELIKEIISNLNGSFQMIDGKIIMNLEKLGLKFWVKNVNDINLINGVFCGTGDAYKVTMSRGGGGGIF
jgi:hypothetical protein